MKILKQKLILSVVIALFLFTILTGNVWAYMTLPHAMFDGLMLTYLDNGANDDIMLMYSTISSIIYSDGTSGAADSILFQPVTITGSKRISGTAFTDATLRIGEGASTYFSAQLSDINFEIVNGLWRLNPGLDSSNPLTLNLSNIVLNPQGSAYIQDFANALGSNNLAGLTMTLDVLEGNINGNSSSMIIEGLIAAPAPIPEPSSLILLLSGGATLGARLYRKKKISNQQGRKK